ncbi:MFS transporter [Carnobacterium maltaromaticum]|uniref:MFS transporter n=1 Tax=Carnobacterium maltaromaticum TaxID=2751 RepID=UPI00107236CD|nr:MFS transporter [Carnobacterium maltaromaticum]TFJ77469.1 MFS transporter [Carnobacterium maltaromaticum]TFJ79602.1 MFS transporter [Carnobacterium maltaromaticum]
MLKKSLARRLTIQYGLLQSMYWMGFCAIMGFATVFLLYKDFEGQQIGVILAVSNICAALLQPVIASFADRSKHVTLKTIISFLAFIVILLTILLVLIPVNKVIIALLFILIGTVVLTIQPLLNSLIFEYINRGIKINYGLARGLGSLSFAAISFVLGFIVNRFSPAVLPYLYIFFYTFILLIAYSFKMPRVLKEEPDLSICNSPSKKTFKLAELTTFFKRYHNLYLLLISVCCLFIFHNIISTYLIQIMQNVGGSDTDFGISLALAASVELPTMMGFAYLVRKIKGSTLLKVSAIFFTVKALVFLLAPSVGVIYLGQILQALSFALYIPASVYYMNELMEPTDRIKGQAIIMVAMTLGGVFGNLIGGILLDNFTIFVMLVAGVIFSLLGTLLLCYSVKEI